MVAKWLNVEKASKYIGVSTSNLYSMAQAGRVPAHRIGKMWRFDAGELDGWIRTNKPINEFFMSVDYDVDNNLKLRLPQREAYSSAYEFFSKKGRKAIIQLPVGCGKSGLIAILPFGISRGRVLVIAPNLTIKEELAASLDIANRRECFWHKCKILAPEVMSAGPYLAVLDSMDANIHDCDQSHFVLTNIQQLASSANKWLSQFEDDYFDLILVDEGHHNVAISWRKVFEKFPDAKVVSLTATPFRSDQKELEGKLIYKYSFKSAMIKGYIKRLQASYVAPKEFYFTFKGDKKYYTLDDVLALKDEEWFSRGVALSKVCNEHIVDASLGKLEFLRQMGTNHQLIAVACSVDHARQIRSLYVERGYNAAEIHSNMSLTERENVIRDLRAGSLDCIVQVQMLGEGFDHPKLSVAAIFRPFRNLSPYVQFVGRIMRVIVQNIPNHPDNIGHIVTHIGLNLDKHMQDFRQLDKADQEFFKGLLEGNELDIPEEVLAGDTRTKMSREMVVNDEIIENFLEEDFISLDDEELRKALKATAENLGFDAEQIEAFLSSQAVDKFRSVKASGAFAKIPQKQRQEARRRLNEKVKSSAIILLNRLNLTRVGHDLMMNTDESITGINFVAAVQMISQEVNNQLGIESGERGKLKIEELEKGLNSLDDIVNRIHRRLLKMLDKKDE